MSISWPYRIKHMRNNSYRGRPYPRLSLGNHDQHVPENLWLPFPTDHKLNWTFLVKVFFQIIKLLCPSPVDKMVSTRAKSSNVTILSSFLPQIVYYQTNKTVLHLFDAQELFSVDNIASCTLHLLNSISTTFFFVFPTQQNGSYFKQAHRTSSTSDYWR